MTVENDDTPLFAYRFAGRAANLKPMRQALAAALEQAGCDDATRDDIVLASDEACQNIIRHAYGGETDQPIEVELHRELQTLTVLIRDFAAPVNIDKITPRSLDDLRPGGLGTHFMQEIMDEVDIRPLRNGDGNLLRMTKNLD